MLRLILKRILTFSSVTALAFALLMVDTDSPSLISEAQACDPQTYDVCEFNCSVACSWGNISECLPWYGCDCAWWCPEYCRGVSGC
jgi:hypothetical protein